MDSGILALRLVLGLLMAAHGSQKLFGWFGGHGLAGTGGFFEGLGFRPGRAFAAAAATSEVGSGLLIALGLFGPVGPALMVSVMVVAAVSVHGRTASSRRRTASRCRCSTGSVARRLRSRGPEASRSTRSSASRVTGPRPSAGPSSSPVSSAAPPTWPSGANPPRSRPRHKQVSPGKDLLHGDTESFEGRSRDRAGAAPALGRRRVSGPLDVLVRLRPVPQPVHPSRLRGAGGVQAGASRRAAWASTRTAASRP